MKEVSVANLHMPRQEDARNAEERDLEGPPSSQVVFDDQLKGGVAEDPYDEPDPSGGLGGRRRRTLVLLAYHRMDGREVAPGSSLPWVSARPVYLRTAMAISVSGGIRRRA